MKTKQDIEINIDATVKALLKFRTDVDQWLNLITTRLPTGRWSGLYESDEKRDYLGLKETLAESGARLHKELDSLLGKQVINESLLTDVIEYCALCENSLLSDSPMPTNFFIPALDILDTELQRLSNKERPTLQPDDILILNILHSADLAMHQEDIVAATDSLGKPLSRPTIGKRLNSLREIGLVHRPHKDRGGDAITKAGRELIKNK